MCEEIHLSRSRLQQYDVLTIQLIDYLLLPLASTPKLAQCNGVKSCLNSNFYAIAMLHLTLYLIKTYIFIEIEIGTLLQKWYQPHFDLPPPYGGYLPIKTNVTYKIMVLPFILINSSWCYAFFLLSGIVMRKIIKKKSW